MKEKQPSVTEELREIAPGLADLKREQPYKVPYNYFRQLPDEVVQRIREEAGKPSIWEQVVHELQALAGSWRQPRFALVYASLLALVVAAVFLNLPANDSPLLADISTDAALEYVLDNLEDYEPAEIYAIGNPAELTFAGLDEMSGAEIDEAIDLILEDLDTESLDEIF